MGKSYTYQQVQEIFEKYGMKLLSELYVKNDEKLSALCSCGKKWETSLNNFNKLKHKTCPSCRQKTLYDLEQVKEEYERRGYKLLATTYKNDKSPLDCLCSCGRPAKISLYDLKKGYRCRECWLESHSGKNNCNYNPNLTAEDRDRERSRENKAWAKAVKEKDNYTCQVCGKRGGTMNSHHLYNYSKFPEFRTELKNGKCLCRSCHYNFHQGYGYKENEASDYLFFKNGEDSLIVDFAGPFSLKAFSPDQLNKAIKETQGESFNNVPVEQFLGKKEKKEKKNYHYNQLSTGYSKDYFNSINK